MKKLTDTVTFRHGATVGTTQLVRLGQRAKE